MIKIITVGVYQIYQLFDCGTPRSSVQEYFKDGEIVFDEAKSIVWSTQQDPNTWGTPFNFIFPDPPTDFDEEPCNCPICRAKRGEFTDVMRPVSDMELAVTVAAGIKEMERRLEEDEM